MGISHLTDDRLKPLLLTAAPAIGTHALGQLFRYDILKTLLSRGTITEATVTLMAKWQGSGFGVHRDPRILLGR